MQRPLDLSLLQLAQRFPRHPLLVPPSQWTDLHIRVLGMRFLHAGAHDEAGRHAAEYIERGRLRVPVPCRPLASLLPARLASEVEWWARVLATAKDHGHRADAVISLMQLEEGMRFSPRQIWFQFGDRMMHLPSLLVFVPVLDPVPSVAFLEHESVDEQRSCRRLLLNRAGRPVSSPLLRIRECQERQLQPADPRADPIMVAVIIALAQAQQEDRPRGRVFKCCVVMHHGRDQLHIYFAQVTAELLDAFARPNVAGRGMAWSGQARSSMDVVRVGVEYWPLDTFHQRFCRALTREVGERDR